MDYIEVFNQLDQKLSHKIERLQKQQEHLLQQKKHLVETKQKIQGFLTDAYEMKKLLDFNSELSQSVQTELNRIFKSEGKVKLVNNNHNNQQTNVESDADTSKNLELDPQVVIETEDQEPIRIFQFVDSEGKNTSF